MTKGKFHKGHDIRGLLKDESEFIVQRRGKGRGEEGQEIACEKAL